jgi:UDP-N-acetylmuramoyl-L-alanyl-D-glutamate--2,6-diaminopimelate ligase
VHLRELLAGLEHVDPSFASVEVRGERDVDLRTIEHDSRRVSPGALFCCIPGAHVDGHDFAAMAVSKGAVACVVERWLPLEVPQVRVPSVRRTLGPLCARFYGEPSRAMRVLGVTGTNGKTTTTYLLEQIANAAGERTGVIGTTGARVAGAAVAVEHTTPEATDLQHLLARMRDDDVQSVAMEVSSHAIDQHRVDGTWYAAACFTNLTHDHLDYHGTVEAYFEAKAQLFTPEFTTRAAVCTDDEHGRALAQRVRALPLELRTYGSGADVDALDVSLASDRTTMTIAHDGARMRVHTTLVGRFNVSNVLGAYATATLAGYAPEDVVAGLERPIVVPGRMERVDAGAPFTVLVDYAHTPAALEAVLRAARPLAAPGARVLVVFGAGGDRDRDKRPLMGNVAEAGSDATYVTSDNPRSEDPGLIVDDIVAGMTGTSLIVELDRRSAIRRALQDARPGDVVVIAGKGHESGQTANGVTVPFDDRVVAREEIEARV